MCVKNIHVYTHKTVKVHTYSLYVLHLMQKYHCGMNSVQIYIYKKLSMNLGECLNLLKC